MENNPLKIGCKKCGSPIGFDIFHQTYACRYCGEKPELIETTEKWTELSEIRPSAEGQAVEEHYCPSCGAHIIFGAGEASVTCDFCGGKLVRKDFAEGGRLPSLILPFFITQEEAKERLLKWAKENKRKPEGKSILRNINNLKAYYLPYELVRGPVYAEVKRDGTDRKYKCRGYMEGTAVNTSKQFHNLILHMAEPFDWSRACPFSHGFLAGQNVKLADISAADAEKRILAEAEADFLPQVESVMQTTGVNLKLQTGDMLAMPILVPMFFIREGKLTAVVNGQTGRVAASVQRARVSFPWVIEPLLYTVLATVLSGLPFRFDVYVMLFLGMFFAVLFFAMMSDGRNSLIRSLIFQSDNAKAQREGKTLHLEEGKDALKNPYDSTPVFVEKNAKGEEVPVKIRFYSFGRLLGIFLRMLALMGLPTYIAAIIRLLTIWGTDEPFMKYFEIQSGAAWYVLFGLICVVYWIRGARRDVYEHPIIYEILEGGKTKLMGNRASRRVGILSMFGAGKSGKGGKPVTLFGLLRGLGGQGVFLVCVILFILIGCIGAILF